VRVIGSASSSSAKALSCACHWKKEVPERVFVSDHTAGFGDSLMQAL
jgi:hypothetical protein